MVDEGLGLNDYSTIMLNLQVTTETEGGREERRVSLGAVKKKKSRLKPDCDEAHHTQACTAHFAGRNVTVHVVSGRSTQSWLLNALG